MAKLITAPNITRPDEIYNRLIALHEDVNESDCRRIDARLILLLLNHIGDEAAILEAFERARLTSTSTSSRQA
jgi:hypothetical protein